MSPCRVEGREGSEVDFRGDFKKCGVVRHGREEVGATGGPVKIAIAGQHKPGSCVASRIVANFAKLIEGHELQTARAGVVNRTAFVPATRAARSVRSKEVSIRPVDQWSQRFSAGSFGIEAMQGCESSSGCDCEDRAGTACW